MPVLLSLVRQRACEDAARDIDFVLAWHPHSDNARQLADLLFVVAQVLTVGEPPRQG